VVVVAAADALAFDVAGFVEVGDDGLGCAFGDVEASGDVADADLGVLGDEEEGVAVVGEEREAAGFGVGWGLVG
jgi:hypothetical protein